MTNPQKILIRQLLQGGFLRPSKTRNGKDCYRLYDSKSNVIAGIRTRTVDSIDRFIDPKIKIWKRSKDGKISLNLSMVRQLHGRNTIKRMYKLKDETTALGSIYKTRKRKSKNNQNEKVYYLF